VRLRQLSARLKQESDNVKRAAQLAHEEKHPPRAHNICVGDYVWLTLDTDEKARMIRKYGHGASWKHHYEVIEVRPHAVRLKIPPDAPPVMEWQSLRKCSQAPAQLHDYSSAIPVDVHGRLLITPPVSDATVVPPGKTEALRYLIERILRAERKGSGWQLTVKWVGYDEITYEPLSRIVTDTRGDPDIARQIRECQEAYLVEHPEVADVKDTSQKGTTHASNVAVVPTRIQPTRNRNSQHQETQAVQSLIAEVVSCDMLTISSRQLAHHVRRQLALHAWIQDS